MDFSLTEVYIKWSLHKDTWVWKIKEFVKYSHAPEKSKDKARWIWIVPSIFTGDRGRKQTASIDSITHALRIPSVSGARRSPAVECATLLNKVTKMSLPVSFFSLFFPRVRRTITITIITERASGRILLYIHGVLRNKRCTARRRGTVEGKLQQGTIAHRYSPISTNKSSCAGLTLIYKRSVISDNSDRN